MDEQLLKEKLRTSTAFEACNVICRLLSAYSQSIHKANLKLSPTEIKKLKLEELFSFKKLINLHLNKLLNIKGKNYDYPTKN
jgi:hypothetical protein